MSYPVTRWFRYLPDCGFAIPLLERGNVPWHIEEQLKWFGTRKVIHYRVVRDDLNMLPVSDGHRHPRLVEVNTDTDLAKM